jgi:hypothetical protein
MPLVTIAILNYNGVSHLETFLPAVLKHSTGSELVIIDNGSTDASAKFIQENYPQVKLIQLNKNYGFCEGYNQGLKELSSDYYILLNSDVEVTPGWIDQIIEMMESDNKIAACQPKILSYSERSKFEYAGAAGGFIDWLGYPFCRGRIFNHLEEDFGQYDEPMQVFWASGACLFIKSHLFHEMGGFKPEFFAHMEEIDLCWRLQNAGYAIWCNPKSRVFHLGGGTLDRFNPEKTYLNFRNNLATVFSNMTILQLFLVLPMRVVLDLVAAASFLFTGGFRHFWAVFRAYFSLPGLVKKRGSTGSGQVRLYPSIVWATYIRGIRKFSDLKG